MKPLILILTIFLAGCSARYRGNETAPLQRHLASATTATAAARGDVKQVRALSGSIGRRLVGGANLQRRIEAKSVKALEILNR